MVPPSGWVKVQTWPMNGADMARLLVRRTVWTASSRPDTGPTLATAPEGGQGDSARTGPAIALRAYNEAPQREAPRSHSAAATSLDRGEPGDEIRARVHPERGGGRSARRDARLLRRAVAAQGHAVGGGIGAPARRAAPGLDACRGHLLPVDRARHVLLRRPRRADARGANRARAHGAPVLRPAA